GARPGRRCGLRSGRGCARRGVRQLGGERAPAGIVAACRRRRAGVDMTGDAWIDDEPSIVGVASEVFKRAFRRLPLAVAMPAVLASLAGIVRFMRPPSYEATLYFRMAETDVIDPSAAPPPPREIRSYIESVAISQRRLL